MAALAASQICLGVGKFGSPTARLVTSTPCALSSRARLLTLRVREGLMLRKRSEICMEGSLEERHGIENVALLTFGARTRRKRTKNLPRIF